MLRHENRPKVFRTLSMLCESESLSDAQLKAYQTRLQEYRTYLEAVSRLANCGNVCITEEAVMIGDNGLLTGESLNALQHAGAISVYNTLQQNNWEFPVPEEGEVAVLKTHTTVPDDFLDSEKPIRSDWPSVFVSECFVEGEKAKLHGSARPLKTFLPPSIVFRSAADMDDDLPEPELPSSSALGPETGLEIVSVNDGLAIRKTKESDGTVECIPIDEYYYGRQDGNKDYAEDKAEFRFKCAVCQLMFYNNIKLMHHIMGHVDEGIQALIGFTLNQCRICNESFANAFLLRAHMEKDHGGANIFETNKTDGSEGTQLSASGYSCRICGKEAASDLALAHHLQSTHRQREMPYVCRICLFRSSLYEDVLEHFKKVHNGSNHLLCFYCLRYFTPTDARVPGIPLTSPTGTSGGAVSTAGLGAGVGQTQVYLQHLRMHQVQHQLRRCPSCRLNFTNKSDYQVHRRLDHKAGSSSSAAAVEQQIQRQQAEEQAQLQEHVDEQEQIIEHVEDHAQEEQHNVEEYMTTAESLKRQQQERQASIQAAKRGQIVEQMRKKAAAAAEAEATAAAEAAEQDRVILLNVPETSRTKDLSAVKLPSEAVDVTCLECGELFSSENHKQYLPCSSCVFATCCASGFTRHVHRSHNYAQGINRRITTNVGAPMLRPVASFDWIAQPDGQPLEINQMPRVNPVDASFACPKCAFTGVDGNTLAKHLVEVCGVEGATLQPDPNIVSARRQAEQEQEEQARLSQEHQEQEQQEQQHEPMDFETSGAVGVYTDEGQAVVEQAQPSEAIPAAGGGALVAAPETIVTLGTAGNVPSTIDIADPSGEVVQRLVIPEDLHLEPGQTLILLQGEDGIPQLAVINQAEWDATNQQQAQAEDDASNLLLYGNAEGDTAEEKENQM